MAGLFGIGGSGAKTDRKFQLQSWGDLQSLVGPAATKGETQTKEGIGGLSKARNYFEAIASGDPAKMNAVLAPQISAIKGQTGQAVNTLNQFSGRSGGTASAAQQLSIEASRSIQNLFDILGPEAMKEVSQISGTQEALGQGLTDIAASAAGEMGAQASGDITGARQRQDAQQGAILEGLGSLFGL